MAASFVSVIVQIMLLDIVFSLDSVITAVGMVDELWVMIAAVVIAVGIMMVSAEPISAFVHRHPTVKMLALELPAADRAVAGAEGFDQHIPKGYIYFAMGFSVFVEMINLRLREAEAGAPPRTLCRGHAREGLKRNAGPRRLRVTGPSRSDCLDCWRICE